jgi:hypothetical protein
MKHLAWIWACVRAASATVLLRGALAGLVFGEFKVFEYTPGWTERLYEKLRGREPNLPRCLDCGVGGMQCGRWR